MESLFDGCTSLLNANNNDSLLCSVLQQCSSKLLVTDEEARNALTIPAENGVALVTGAFTDLVRTVVEKVAATIIDNGRVFGGASEHCLDQNLLRECLQLLRQLFVGESVRVDWDQCWLRFPVPRFLVLVAAAVSATEHDDDQQNAWWVLVQTLESKFLVDSKLDASESPSGSARLKRLAQSADALAPVFRLLRTKDWCARTKIGVDTFKILVRELGLTSASMLAKRSACSLLVPTLILLFEGGTNSDSAALGTDIMMAAKTVASETVALVMNASIVDVQGRDSGGNRSGETAENELVLLALDPFLRPLFESAKKQLQLHDVAIVSYLFPALVRIAGRLDRSGPSQFPLSFCDPLVSVSVDALQWSDDWQKMRPFVRGLIAVTVYRRHCMTVYFSKLIPALLNAASRPDRQNRGQPNADLSALIRALICNCWPVLVLQTDRNAIAARHYSVVEENCRQLLEICKKQQETFSSDPVLEKCIETLQWDPKK